MVETFIRPLKAEDRVAWSRLWTSYLEFYQTRLPPEVTEDLFVRLIGESGHQGLVAERGGALIGFAHYLFHPSTWSAAPSCYLEDLFIDANMRGTGAGRRLIEAVYTAADRAGGGAVYWHTHHQNVRARQLYDRVGNLTDFVKYERPQVTNS